jgi:hypothetical protein
MPQVATIATKAVKREAPLIAATHTRTAVTHHRAAIALAILRNLLHRKQTHGDGLLCCLIVPEIRHNEIFSLSPRFVAWLRVYRVHPGENRGEPHVAPRPASCVTNRSSATAAFGVERH